MIFILFFSRTSDQESGSSSNCSNPTAAQLNSDTTQLNSSPLVNVTSSTAASINTFTDSQQGGKARSLPRHDQQKNNLTLTTNSASNEDLSKLNVSSGGKINQNHSTTHLTNQISNEEQQVNSVNTNLSSTLVNNQQGNVQFQLTNEFDNYNQQMKRDYVKRERKYIKNK
jgi:hypothetical protein